MVPVTFAKSVVSGRVKFYAFARLACLLFEICKKYLLGALWL